MVLVAREARGAADAFETVKTWTKGVWLRTVTGTCVVYTCVIAHIHHDDAPLPCGRPTTSGCASTRGRFAGGCSGSLGVAQAAVANVSTDFEASEREVEEALTEAAESSAVRVFPWLAGKCAIAPSSPAAAPKMSEPSDAEAFSAAASCQPATNGLEARAASITALPNGSIMARRNGCCDEWHAASCKDVTAGGGGGAGSGDLCAAGVGDGAGVCSP